MQTKTNFTSYEYQQLQRKEALEALRVAKEKDVKTLTLKKK